MGNISKKKKIIVAMSGGVDSSVAAAILKSRGYEVCGVYLRLFDNGLESQDLNRKLAAKAAEILGIDFEVIDARKKFKDKVIGYFLDEYKKGRTPNPCVVCNPELKFKIIMEHMREKKADFVATGHYAKIAKREARNAKQYVLMEARDKNKDQSYFLYRLTQKQLSKIIFPLENYLKTEVKKMAKKLNLPASGEKESQDVCFLENSTLSEFLAENIKIKPGEIADKTGKIIGRHAGLPLYTLGQRKGINIGGTGPYYVTGKDYRKNRLIVANDTENPAIFLSKAQIYNVNWIAGLPKTKKILARTRYRNPLVCATITMKHGKSGGKYIIKFSKPQRAVTPGQSIVFYVKSGEVVGGGIIFNF